MWRRAHALGFTHVCTKHGYYRKGEGFVVEDIPSIVRKIPKLIRIEA
jgi:hypothetical protein